MLQIAVKGPQGKGARSRGQLSSLIADAVNNREKLEEKIAQGKSNRNNSSRVYGKLVINISLRIWKISKTV